MTDFLSFSESCINMEEVYVKNCGMFKEFIAPEIGCRQPRSGGRGSGYGLELALLHRKPTPDWKGGVAKPPEGGSERSGALESGLADKGGSKKYGIIE